MDNGEQVTDLSGDVAVVGTVRELRAPRHHTLRWLPATPDAAPPQDAAADLLVVHDNPALAGALATAVRARGGRVAEAALGGRWQALEGVPGEADYARLLAGQGDRCPGHVVFVAAASEGDQTDPAVQSRQLDRGVHSLFGLIRALGTAGVSPERLTVVAPFATAVTGDEPRLTPAHATLFGLVKVYGLENEGTVCRCLDVADDTPGDVLYAELVADDRPGLVAFRGAGRYVTELSEVRLPDPQSAAPVPRDAVYLITGGLGGLGLAVAEYLAKAQPSVGLALVDRHTVAPRENWPEILREPASPEARRIAAIQAIEAAGARVRCYQGDVADPDDMARVVTAARHDLGRITTVVHAAGTAADGFIPCKKPDVFRRTLAPKVRGAAVLDAATRDDPPDLMVLFSSTTAVFGAAGQSDYTAANMYLDAFAAYRNRQGRPTRTVNWTDWLGAGMAFDHGVRCDQGFFRSIEIEDGIASFRAVLAGDLPQVIVGEINYAMLGRLDPQVLRRLTARAPLVLAAPIQQAVTRVAAPAGPAGTAPAGPAAPAEPARAAVGGSDGAWFPLSHPQQGFWLLHTLGDAGADLNLPVWEDIRRPVDVDKLRAAVDLLVQRHSALRLVIRGTPAGPRQRVLAGHALEVPLVDLSAHPDPPAEVDSLMRAESRQVFDFTAPPVRARLYRLADDHYCFFLNVHHIIADGLSLGLLMRELRAVHEGLVSGRPAELPELTASYESYVRDQQRWLAGPESAAPERYWREQLAGPLPRLRLADGVAEPGGRIDFVAFHLDAPTTAAVTAAARRLRVTVNTFLVSGYVTVLRLLTGGEDIIVGIPFSGRYAKELEDLVGLFVNSLALRVRTAGLVTFANVVRQVERQSLGALVHSRYPFNVLVEKLNPRRDSGRNPIFSTAFQYARFLPPAYQTAGLDLGLYGRPDGDRIELRASYHSRRLTAARVNALVAGFGLVVAEGAADPGRPVAELGRRMAQAGLAPAGPDGASAGDTPRGRLQDLLAARVRADGGR